MDVPSLQPLFAPVLFVLLFVVVWLGISGGLAQAAGWATGQRDMPPGSRSPAPRLRCPKPERQVGGGSDEGMLIHLWSPHHTTVNCAVKL